jgi:dolichol-phosphate hexosyltransferase
MVTILIPSLNEESGVKKTLSSIPTSKLYQMGYNTEVILIDGGSIDSTREIASQMGAKVIVESQKGYGRAYKTGFAEAKGDIIVTLDADGTYPAEHIPYYIEQLKKKDVDFITVNRFSKMEKGAMSISHKVGNKILSMVMHILYSIDIKDSQSGMWIMKKGSFINNIALNSDDMSMSEEIKIIAFKYFKSLEIDGKYFNRIGKPKLQTYWHGWKNLKYLFHYKKLIKFANIQLAKPLMPGEEIRVQEKTF